MLLFVFREADQANQRSNPAAAQRLAKCDLMYYIVDSGHWYWS